MEPDLIQLRSYLQRAIAQPARGREIEARWKVSKAQFYQVMQQLAVDPPVREFYRDKQYPLPRAPKGQRLRLREIFAQEPVANAVPLRKEWTLKATQDAPYLSDYGYLAASAIETPNPPSNEKASGVRLSVRSAIEAEAGLRLDFIENLTGPGDERYRIEAELAGDDIELLLDWVPRLTSLIQGSHIPISLKERACVFQSYNSLMEGKSAAVIASICQPVKGPSPGQPSAVTDRFLRGSLPHPEDLTLDELASGAPWSEGPTTLTVKADGEVTELLFLQSGIYAVSGQDQINKLLNNNIGALAPAIYQGEIVEPYEKANINSAYTFVMFETLYVKGAAVRNIANLAERHAKQPPLLSLFGKARQHPDLTILLKEFPVVTDADSWYTASNRLLDQIARTNAKVEAGEALTDNDLLYPTDGLIATQGDKPYQRDRIKIRKVKERHNLTLDLTVRSDGLYVSDDRPGKKGLVLFTGNRTQPFAMSAARITRMVAAKAYMFYEDIWEFGFDEEFNVLPIRPRHRKSTPNRWTTAQNVWRLILKPLEETTVRGTDLVLMRKYHNNVKRAMIETLPKGSLHLDMGSGRGGDLGKFKDQDLQVFLLEPDANNRAEMLRRIEQNKWQSMVKGIADYGAEQHERVLGELLGGRQVDSISLMLILTFFFGQPEVLQGLITSIAGALKVGGKLLVLTFNGERVVAGMRGAGKMIGPMYSLERRGGRELLVSLGEESIVVEQTEWLTDLVTFNRIIAAHDIVPVKEWHLTETANFPRPQRLLSAMYTAVIYERRAEAPPPEAVAPEVEEPEEFPEETPAPAASTAEDFIDMLDDL
jgi:SAM-dependent methyltransferase